jgi:hypothetical protein
MMSRMTLRLASLVLVAACAHRAAQPAVHVRLARDGEFPATWNATDWRWNDCALEGANDRQLYEPAIEYARRTFDGTAPVIEVDPKNKVGRMEISTRWTFESYCVHVLEENGHRVLVLVPPSYSVEY